MTDTNFPWPTREDYDIVVGNALRERVFDTDLNKGLLALSHAGSILHPGGTNLYVCLYKIDTETKSWIMRCFCKSEQRNPPDDIATRYEHISQFCNKHAKKVSALLPISFIKDGIEVDLFQHNGDEYTLLKSDTFPLVKMPFVKAPALGSFIAANYQNQTTMKLLCKAWLKMIGELEDVRMAHGDLDLTNVLVIHNPQQAQLTLKLIDYDNAWVPALEGYTQPEYGHEPFQHPAFFPPHDRPYNAQMDRFSALSIYISLSALAARPDIYADERWEIDDNHLLFSTADYKAEQMHHSSPRMAMLSSMNIAGLQLYLAELRNALQNNRMPDSLQKIAAQHASKKTKKPTPEPALMEENTFSMPVTDWKNAHYYKKQDEPLIDILPATRETILPRPSFLPPPELHTSLPPHQTSAHIQHTHDAPTAPTGQSLAPQFQPGDLPTKHISSQRETWLGCLLLLLVVLLIIVVIVFVVSRFTTHQAQIFHSTLLAFTQQQLTDSAMNTLTTNPLAQMASFSLPMLKYLQFPTFAVSRSLTYSLPLASTFTNSFVLLAALPVLVAIALFITTWMRQWIMIRRVEAEATMPISAKSPEMQLVKRSSMGEKDVVAAFPLRLHSLNTSLSLVGRKQRKLRLATEALLVSDLIPAVRLTAQALTADYKLWQQLRTALAKIPINVTREDFVKRQVYDAIEATRNDMDEQSMLNNACYILVCGAWYLNFLNQQSTEAARIFSFMGKAYKQISTMGFKTSAFHIEAARDCYTLALENYRLQKDDFEQAIHLRRIGLICISSLPFCVDEVARLRLAIHSYEEAQRLSSNDANVDLQAHIRYELSNAYYIGYTVTNNQEYLQQAEAAYRRTLSFYQHYYPHPEKIQDILSTIHDITARLQTIHS